MIDSTIVRAHQHSAGAKKGGFAASHCHPDIGRSRGGRTTKIHLRANGLGLSVALVLTPAEASDTKGYAPVMDKDDPAPKVTIADKGYESDAIHEDLKARGAEPIISMKRNRLVQVPVDDYIYDLRTQVERCFNRLMNARRVATRCDKTSASQLSFTLIGARLLWIGHFVNKAWSQMIEHMSAIGPRAGHPTRGLNLQDHPTPPPHPWQPPGPAPQPRWQPVPPALHRSPQTPGRHRQRQPAQLS